MGAHSLNIEGSSQVGRGAAHITQSPWDVEVTPLITRTTREYTSGIVETGTESRVTINATPLANCGWKWDHWEITVVHAATQETLTVTIENQEHTVVIPKTLSDGDYCSVICIAFFRFEGTGLIMATDDGTKILTSMNDETKLLIDN